jgi:hypothetical protein
MKEFVEKLIGRLEEESELLLGGFGRVHYSVRAIQVHKVKEIVKQLAEEYNNGFCEWKLDGVYLMCQHKTELFVSCLEDKKYRYKYCPICGKKIKAVE